MVKFKAYLIFCCFVSFSLGASADRSPQTQTKPSSAQNTVTPLSEQKKFQVCGREFTLEVAKTNKDRNQGLMYRTSVDEDKGMIFVFRSARRQSFWMKNVPIDLDILYFDEKGALINSLNMQPASPLVQDRFLKLYESLSPSQYVVELRGGMLKTFSEEDLKSCKLSPLYKIDSSVE